jgi:hypothetical protein
VCVIVRRDDGRGMIVKGNDGGGWSSDGVVLWLGRRQNEVTVEWWGKWPRLRWTFYNYRGWESSGLGRLVGGGGADSIFWFWLEMGGNRTKRYQKMMRRKRARIGSMGMKCDTTWLCGNVGQRRCGTKEGKGRRRHQVGWHKSFLAKKIKKVHMVDSIATNGRWRFKVMMS